MTDEQQTIALKHATGQLPMTLHVSPGRDPRLTGAAFAAAELAAILLAVLLWRIGGVTRAWLKAKL